VERLWIRGLNQVKAAELLFGDQDDFDGEKYRYYEELEIVVQDDGRYSVWGNYTDDADLLQDTRRDSAGAVKRLLALADEILVED